MKNVEFWLAAEDARVLSKFSLGLTNPSDGVRKAGGYYGYEEMLTFLKEDSVVALGELWTGLL